MPNRNCLEGMRCPQCGSEEPFRIVVTMSVKMWDEGSGDDTMGGDQEWDEHSYCECCECEYHGNVGNFRH